MAWRFLRFACAVGAAAIIVPFAGAAIQINLIAIGNGHGPSLAAGVSRGVAVLPLALLAAPIYAVGAVLLGAFSLGLEKLIQRRTVLIWMAHGLIVGRLHLLLFAPVNNSEVISVGAIGSWLIGAVAMKFLISAPKLAEG